jgi:butyryl-CoA dehydrogenase
MEFTFTEEQEMIRDMVRDFVEREVKPRAGELDESESFDRGLFDRMAQLGFTGLPWPEEDGGSGGGFLSYILVLEQLSRVCAAMGAALWAHVYLAAWPLFRFGHGELQRQYLRTLIEGRMLGAGALPHSAERTSPLRSTVTARQDGDGYALEGMQKYVFNGKDADLFVVYAESGESEKYKPYSAFLVEKGTPGLNVMPAVKKLGLRSASMAHLNFDCCRIPKQHRLGRDGQGRTIAGRTAASVRYGLAAIAAGIAHGAADAALAYAKERTQFGKPIGHHQSIAFTLADMRTAADASGLLAYQAAWREDQGLDYAHPSELALIFAADAAMTTATNAVQIFGGYGYMKEYPVERYMRDAKALQIFKGLDGMRRRR